MRNKIDFFHNELNRTMERLKFIENKIIFLSGYYAIIIWYCISNKETILWILENDVNCIKKIILALFMITLLMGMFFLFRIMFPSWVNKNTDKSLLYFSQIAKRKAIDFIKEFQDIKEHELQWQILEQIHINSKITDNKMLNVKISTIFLMINLLSFIIFVYLK